MAVRVQVNVNDHAIELIDQYAKMAGISRSALCSIFIANAVAEYKTRLGLPQECFSETNSDSTHLKRFKMLFDGWRAQFKDVPTLLSEITLKDGFVCIDGRLVCPIKAKITSAEYGFDFVGVVWEKDDIKYETNISLSWVKGSLYRVNQVNVYKEPRHKPIELQQLTNSLQTKIAIAKAEAEQSARTTNNLCATKNNIERD